MDYNILIFTLIAIFNIGIALLVFFNNKKNPSNQTFSVFIILVTTWIASAFFSELANDINMKIILSKFAVASGVAGIVTLYYFTKYFPKKRPINWYLLITNLLLSGTFIGLTLFGSFVIENIRLQSWGFDLIYNNIGYIPLSIYGIVIIIATLFNLIKSYIGSTRLEKIKLQYFFLGMGLYLFLIIFFSLILRFITGTDEYYRFGNYSVIFFILATTYSMIRHRLMDIRLVVARSIGYAILLLIFASFYAGAIFGAQKFIFPESKITIGYIIIQIILAIIMAFTFQPLRKWITRITDKIFFKNQYDTEELLDTLAHTIGATIVLIELVYKTLDLLMSQMRITRGMFVILNENGTVYNAQSSGYKESPEVKQEDIQKLAKDGILIYDELEEGSHYKNLLRKYNAAAAISLKTENTTEGLLLLGEKASGDMFSAGDLKVFEIIAPEIAVAVTNAKSFEKIEKFNVTLREEVKKATSELEKKNEQLRELDKAKDEFISMASHQLRTPLTAIKGYLSMLLEGDAGEIKVSQYDFVNEAFSGANRMVGLINDLLNVSRMETGRFFLEPVEVDLSKLVSEEVKQLENHAKEKKLYLKYEPKGKIPHVWVDETKIRQVVMNFIDNALYYTTTGGVTITLEADKKNIIFQVTDTGIGVPKDAQKNLFTKFYRADNARHVRPDGTGLGIYLAKRVMDDHNGEIIFHSEEGKGSTFGFKMPIHSKLKMKRVSAPVPGSSNPPVGELAAGMGVPTEALEATSLENQKKPVKVIVEKKKKS